MTYSSTYQDTQHRKIECHFHQLQRKHLRHVVVYLEFRSLIWFDPQFHQQHYRNQHSLTMQPRFPIDSQLRKNSFQSCSYKTSSFHYLGIQQYMTGHLSHLRDTQFHHLLPLLSYPLFLFGHLSHYDHYRNRHRLTNSPSQPIHS